MSALHADAALLPSVAAGRLALTGCQETNMDFNDYFAGLPPQDPKKPRREPRKLIGVRVSGAERGTILQRAAAAGLPISTYVRQAALGAQVRATVPALNRGAWQELARTAANLNQIVKLGNQGRVLGALGLRPILDQLSREVAQLRLALIANSGEAEP